MCDYQINRNNACHGLNVLRYACVTLSSPSHRWLCMWCYFFLISTNFFHINHMAITIFLCWNSWIFIHSNITSDMSSITLFIQLTYLLLLEKQNDVRIYWMYTSNTLTSYHQFHFIIRICVVFVFISLFHLHWTENSFLWKIRDSNVLLFFL